MANARGMDCAIGGPRDAFDTDREVLPQWPSRRNVGKLADLNAPRQPGNLPSGILGTLAYRRDRVPRAICLVLQQAERLLDRQSPKRSGTDTRPDFVHSRSVARIVSDRRVGAHLGRMRFDLFNPVPFLLHRAVVARSRRHRTSLHPAPFEVRRLANTMERI